MLFIDCISRFSAGSKNFDARIRRDRDFVIRCLVKNKISDRRLQLTAPLVAVMHGEHGISGAEQHHATTAKVDIAGTTRFAVAAQRGADLFDDVRRQARFVAVDLRN